MPVDAAFIYRERQGHAGQGLQEAGIVGLWRVMISLFPAGGVEQSLSR